MQHGWNSFIEPAYQNNAEQATDSDPIRQTHLKWSQCKFKNANKINLDEDAFTWTSGWNDRGRAQIMIIEGWYLKDCLLPRLEGNENLCCAILQYLPCVDDDE